MKAIPLQDQPFSYLKTKDGQLRIFHSGKLAKTLRGKAATRFFMKVESIGANEAQLLMARETGQFKFGNERHQD